MAYVNKRKLKKPVLILLIVLAIGIALVGGFFLVKALGTNYPKEMTTKDTTDKNTGKYKIMKKVINDDFYVLHYPSTGEKPMDKWIQETMQETFDAYTAAFQTDEEIVHKIKQDYKSEKTEKRFTSVSITTYVDDKLVETDTRTYDSVTKNFVNPTIFKDKAVRIIIDGIRTSAKEHTLERSEFMKLTNIDEKFNDIYIKGNKMSFIFNFGTYEIDLKENNAYLKEDFGKIKADKDADLPSVYLDYGYEATDKMVAFTFDDGPYSKNGEKILEKFKEYDGHATFFILGSRVEADSEILVDLLDNGHQIASHSYDHPNFTGMTQEAIQSQLDKTAEVLKNTTGFAGEIYVRPPYGAILEPQRRALANTFINWSVDTEDWLYRDAQRVCQNTVDGAYDGAIILMHELYESTVESLDCILPKLKEAGYKFVTTKELLEAKGNDVQHGQLYFNAN